MSAYRYWSNYAFLDLHRWFASGQRFTRCLSSFPTAIAAELPVDEILALVQYCPPLVVVFYNQRKLYKRKYMEYFNSTHVQQKNKNTTVQSKQSGKTTILIFTPIKNKHRQLFNLTTSHFQDVTLIQSKIASKLSDLLNSLNNSIPN